MSLRHTIKSLLSGPQAQAPPPSGYNYGQPQPQQQQQYGNPAAYGYNQSPVPYGPPAGHYAPPPPPPHQGQTMVPHTPQQPGVYSQQPQLSPGFPPPQQQQPQPGYQYQHQQAPAQPSQPAHSPAPVAYNNNPYSPHVQSPYQHPPGPPQSGYQQHPLQQFTQTAQYTPPQQFSPTPPSTFPPQQPQIQGASQTPLHYGASPPVPSATHPSNQQPAGLPTPQFAQFQPASPIQHEQQRQQPPSTPLSPPPPYVQVEQQPSSQQIPSFSQQPSPSIAAPLSSYTPEQTNFNLQTQGLAGQSLQHSYPPEKSPSYLSQIPARVPSASKSQTRDALGPTPEQSTETSRPSSRQQSLRGSDAEPPTPSGIIHPSMLAQWSAATNIKSGQIPKLPSAQPQSPPESINPNPPIPTTAPSQPSYSNMKGHKSTESVNRSFTFSKKNADGSPNWKGVLLTIDGLAAETFTRFVDGIYNFAGRDEDPLGLTPDQMRVVLERLDMPEDRNFPKRYALAAQKTNQSDPTSFINTNLIICYTIFNLSYITESNLMPIVTREGFSQFLTTEVLIDPSSMHTRLNRLLANFGHQIIDPLTKKPFGNIQFDRACLPSIPNDQNVARDKKQMEALKAREESENSQQYGVQQGSRSEYQSSWGI